MPDRTKRRHVNSITGTRGVELARSCFPEEWVIREITPDFGLDLHIEVFEPTEDDPDSADTAGEHFFAQVKTVKDGLHAQTLTVRQRMNVAKYRRAVPDGRSHEIQVFSHGLETTEIKTIEAMGAGVPVLLLLVDLSEQAVYYVCLNDYIEKVLLPVNQDYSAQGSCTIHVPTRNRLDPSLQGFAYVRLLARRSKLYSAFATFAYQDHELGYALGGFQDFLETGAATGALPEEILEVLEVFLRSNVRLDVWRESDGAVWPPLLDVRDAFQALLDELPGFRSPRGERDLFLFLQRIRSTFARAANLGTMYEEICREWHLPTYFAAAIQ